MCKDKPKMLIPISYLNAYAYCPRRFYYEFVVGEMVVNDHVFEGQQLHERADRTGYGTRGEKIQIRHMYVCAPQLGIAGYLDVVEVEGVLNTDLAVLATQHKLFPVEYKKGKMGKWISDQTQLCAQALALEEVLNISPGSITHGYIFYIGSARRDEICIDVDLRAQTRALLDKARHVAQLQHPPDPITNWRKCKDCSLEPMCLPREVVQIRARRDDHGNTVFN